jgi:hypothetical protein
MAVNATAVWRVRPGGSNTNGGGFDAAISGAGTDYSQQDAAQLSLTDIACSNTPTVTSATGGFTSAMVGNAVWLTGGGATAGPYFITARASTNSITVDRSPGTIAAGSGKVGGAWADFWTNPTSTAPVGGNTVYIRGSGSDNPSVADYTAVGTGTFLSGASGSNTALLKFIGENGRPRIALEGMFYQYGYCYFQNLYIQKTHAGFDGGNGNAMFFQTAYNGSNFYDCVFDLNGYDLPAAISGGSFIKCEIFSSIAARGTTVSNALVPVGSSTAQIVYKCLIHDAWNGPLFGRNGVIAKSVIANMAGTAIYCQNGFAGTEDRALITGNTLIGSSAANSNGIYLASAADAILMSITDNIIANFSGTGAVGLNIGVGSAASNAATLVICEDNQFYNNTADTANFTLSASNTTGTNPSFASTANEDYTPSAAAAAIGFPINRLAGKASMTDSSVVGAIQPAASGGSTTYVINRITNLFGDDYAP